MGYFESGYERVSLDFRGSIAGTFLRLLVQWAFSLLVLPAAWGTAILYRWIVGCVRFSDGTTAAFDGRPGQIWGWLALSMGLLHAPTKAVGVINRANPLAMMFDLEARQASLDHGDPGVAAVYFALWIASVPVVIYVELVVYRWIVAGVRLRDGPVLQFTGTYLPMLGWTLLIVVSVFSIIGWAWVSTAFFRWIASNIEGDAVGFKFEGSGWGFLWRMLIVNGPPAICILILALNGITWAWDWVVATPWLLLTCILVINWYVSNTVMIKVTTSKGADPSEELPTPRSTTRSPVHESPPPMPTTPPPKRESPSPRSKTPTPKPKSPAPKKPSSPPADLPPDVPFPLVVEIKSG